MDETKSERAREPELLAVLPGRMLTWPDGSLRGGPGTCVYEDDPLLRTDSDARGRLGKAPPDAKVTPHSHPGMAAEYRRLGYDRVPYEPKQAPAAAKPAAKAKAKAKGAGAAKPAAPTVAEPPSPSTPAGDAAATP